MATSKEVRVSRVVAPRFQLRKMRRKNIGPTLLITLVGFLVMLLFLLPLGYMITLAFKPEDQLSAQNAPLWPAKPVTFKYNGQDLPLYNVPIDGTIKQLALVKGFREDANFVDPNDLGKGVFDWVGRYRVLDPVYQFAPVMDNFNSAWTDVNFPLLFRNTLIIAVISTIGTLLSCIMVAYGFARFKIPGKNILFIILISTIVLPPQATIIPLFILFTKIGWTGTWLPLLVPAFFANAYDVFLLRQYFMGIPKELDEAAEVDGANPLTTLIRVIVPQAIPAITAVTLFHFFYTWNDYFNPLVYLVGKEDLYPISVGIGKLVGTYGTHPARAMATAVLTMILPAILFFLAQRQFMQGVVSTGVEK
jgi:multiple sugar transport system permease protein